MELQTCWPLKGIKFYSKYTCVKEIQYFTEDNSNSNDCIEKIIVLKNLDMKYG